MIVRRAGDVIRRWWSAEGRRPQDARSGVPAALPVCGSDVERVEARAVAHRRSYSAARSARGVEALRFPPRAGR
ncbi:hypothetical protein M8494_03315 [Serratia ureilytica]